MKVTKEQILAIMPNAKDYVDKFLNYINGYSDMFHIDTPKRMAHFLAQVAHESSELKYTKELGNKAYCYKYEVGNLAKQLGNTQKGDGYLFKGRGLIQITGRANYTAYKNSRFCNGDVVANPQLLELPLGAVKVSMWFWWSHGCNVLSDSDSFVSITKKINGGTNGIESRRKYLNRAKAVFNIK